MSVTKRNGEVVSDEQFLADFDSGTVDMDEYFDPATTSVCEPVKGPLIAHVDIPKRVNVDFPEWMVKTLDAEAKRLAIPRQAVIKMLIDEGLRRRKERE